MNGELPGGWAETTMGAVAEVVGGGTPSAKDSTNFCREGGHPWLTPADLRGFDGLYVSRGARNLTSKGLKESSAKLMPKGAVLMSSRAPIGYLAIAENEVSTNQGFKSFVFSHELDPAFVFFWLRSITDELQEMGSGSTFAEISGSKAKEIPLRVAPIPEQHRIVEKVAALLEQVNWAKRRLDRVPLILKRFRQAVLAATCSGELTREWREAAGLDDWSSIALSELIISGPQNGLYKPQSAYGNGTCIVRIDDFHEGRLMRRWGELRKLSVSKPELASYGLHDGDILINRVNSPKFVGKPLLIAGLDRPAVFESNKPSTPSTSPALTRVMFEA